MKPSSVPPGSKQVLLTFSRHGEPATGRHLVAGECVSLSTQVMWPFLPLGLFLWGPTNDTYFRGVHIGNLLEVDQGAGRIPGNYFTTSRSFAQLLALADAGELELAVEERQVFEMAEATVGHIVRLDIEGPFEQVCLWGLTYSGDGPTYRAEVVYVAPTSDVEGVYSYRGRLIERRLKGESVIAEASAPSEESVCRLLAALHGPGRGRY